MCLGSRTPSSECLQLDMDLQELNHDFLFLIRFEGLDFHKINAYSKACAGGATDLDEGS